MSTSAILSPVTLSEVERCAGPLLAERVAACDGLAYLDSVGRHLEAAAGRAVLGARWAAAVAALKRRGYADV